MYLYVYDPEKLTGRVVYLCPRIYDRILPSTCTSGLTALSLLVHPATGMRGRGRQKVTRIKNDGSLTLSNLDNFDECHGH